MVTIAIPKKNGTCPECDSRIRMNRTDGTLKCSNLKCGWKQKDQFKKETV